MLRRLFTGHPASVEETYFEHLTAALSFSGRMLMAGMACLVHAFLPFLFLRTGSETIAALHERMVAHRRRFPEGRLAARRDAGTTIRAAR